MDRLAEAPIGHNWTITGAVDRAAATQERRHVAVATVRELLAVLAQYEVVALDPWREALHATGAELAESASSVPPRSAATPRAGQPLRWTHTPSTPTVVLLRQLARLAMVTPDASSVRAAALIAALQADRGPRCATEPSAPAAARRWRAGALRRPGHRWR